MHIKTKEELYKIWNKENGLINPETAGRLLNLTGRRITQIWKDNLFTVYYILDIKRPFLSFKDVIYYKETHLNRNKEKDLINK